MDFSWIDFREEDRKKVVELLEKYREIGAVDELGVGVIRDYFADKLFPGTSTRHSKAKYLVLTPYIFKNIEKNTPSTPEDYLKELANKERECAKALIEANPKEDGIIGRRNLRSGINRWVKVGPADIYWSALRKYGIFKYENITLNGYVREIVALRKELKTNTLYRKTECAEKDDLRDDEDAVSNYYINNFWNLPEKSYQNWQENMSNINLSKEEAGFLKERIISSQSKSLLAEILRKEERMNEFVNLLKEESNSKIFDNLEGLIKKWDLPDEIKQDYHLAKTVSDFIYCAQIRFNCIIDNEIWKQEWERYKKTIPEILSQECLQSLFDRTSSLGAIVERNDILKRFLGQLKDIMVKKLNEEDFEEKLDDTVKKWELDKKEERAKLEHNIDSKGYWMGLEKLNYRVRNGQNLITEIWEGLYKC